MTSRIFPFTFASDRSLAGAAPRPRRLWLLLLASLPLQTAFGADDEAAAAGKQGKTPVLAPVVSRAAYDGAAAGAGFRQGKVEMGPLGERSVLDTPYASSSIGAELIENTLATGLTDVLKYLPSAQMEARGGLEVGRPQTRGMQSSVVANNHLDGFNIAGTTAYPMELFERVEVIASLTGALYGPANPAGNFNYVTKRATTDALRRLTFGYGSRGLAKVHADLGGRFGENGVVGYRANLLHEEGEGYVAGSELRRDLVGLAFDVQLGPDTVVELNAHHYAYKKTGYPGGFSYSSTRQLPDAPDPTEKGFGLRGGGLDLETQTGSVRVKHRLNDDWHLVAGVSRQIVDRGFTYPTHALTSDNGDYTSTASSSVAGRFTINSNQLHLNGRIMQGGIRHDVVLGTTGFEWGIHSARQSKRYTLGSGSVHAPQEYDKVAWFRDGGRYHAGTDKQQSVILADTVTFNERWSVLAAVSYSRLTSRSYDNSGATTARYRDSGVSPTVALMYKPRADMTTYVAYADSLQQGATAPDTGVANPGETLSPYRSEQWEAGFKYAGGGYDAGVALFRVERPFAYADEQDNVFREQGLQVNHGLELTLSGDLASGLSAFGGVTLLDPRLRDTVKASTADKRVVGAPKVQANVLLEYAVPGVSGLVVSGNAHYTGKRAANDTNSVWVDSYATLDLGARYSSRLMGRKVVWRLGVNNVTDKRYWASIFPGNVNGTDGGANAFLGTPREVRASVSIDL